MANFISELFSQDKKLVRQVHDRALKIDALSDEYRSLSDEDLQAKTPWLKSRLANGESVDDILVDAFATVREASFRIIKEYPYVVQLMGGIILNQGDIAEMKTGEGKTLTSVLPVYLNALTGKGVHVVTVNEYLAQRDAEWMGEIHRFLGLTVGVNLRVLSPREKRNAFLCDITYTTNAEVGFDYLRDNMVTTVEERVLRPLYFALIDEVDSILIDESRTPLIISGGARQTAGLYQSADRFAKSLGEDDFSIDERSRTVQLTESGVERAEKAFRVKNLYDIENTQMVHHINQAMKANYIMMKDVEYVVQDDTVVIVDQFTGRVMPGREYSDGLHQALEAKEGVNIKQQSITLATITYQNFFRLYEKLSGMTGTAKTEEEEFLKIYNMRVLVIPTNKPIARVDYPDSVYGTRKAKFEALMDEIKTLNEKGQPVLVGTISVEVSEFISKMLDQRRIKHEVLNAKNHAREADIIANAGRKGSVTIATNMAGRGTDIKLGEGVRELGGLAVLGTERHESRRIDNQLRGRSGRQGDPGFSRFYVSVQDDLMVRFGSERMESIFARLGDVPIESKTITNAITNAQKRVEGLNFDTRKTLLEYDDVLRQQREIMYDQRNYVLENENVHDIVHNMFSKVIKKTVNAYSTSNKRDMDVDIHGVLEAVGKLGFQDIQASDDSFRGMSFVEIEEKINALAWKSYEDKIEPYKEQIYPIEKNMVLRIIDRSWIDHIDAMSKLRDGIHLRSYAQSNPLQAYIAEGYEMFDEMMDRISSEITTFCLNVRIEVKAPEAVSETAESTKKAKKRK